VEGEFCEFLGAQGEDEGATKAAAIALDQVVVVAAAEAPKGVGAVVYALMEEVRALGSLAKEQTAELSVSCSVSIRIGFGLTISRN
jgi:hypothetical protein